MSYNKQESAEDSIKFLRELALECASLGGPQSKQVFNLLDEGSYLSVINFTIDYETGDTNDIFYARQIQALVSKQDFIDLGFDLQKDALKKFKDCEEKCRETNIRLETQHPQSDVSAVYHYATRKIAEVLGQVPNLDTLDFSFGPGATTSIKRSRSHPMMKLEDQLTCSTNLVSKLPEFLNEIPEWVNHHIESEKMTVWVDEAKLTFVPKTAKAMRSICTEPTLNTFFQQGFGKYIRKRLKRVNIDLTCQGRNRILAEKGSIDGSVSTIDLSSASDTISRSLVWQLLPYDWAEMLDSLRSPIVRLPDGEKIVLQKFSSMGNSFTFELETLIFWALAYGCLLHIESTNEEKKLLSVYGDDIIMPSRGVSLLLSVLEYSGFSVNSEKSFMSGSFRESCGADFVSGIDVRPFYLKEKISVRYLFVFHNWLMRRFEFHLASVVRRRIPAAYHLFGPDGYGDGHLIGDWNPLPLSRKEKRNGYSGMKFKTWVATPKKLKFLKRNIGGWVSIRSSVYALYCAQSIPSDPLSYMDGKAAKEHNIVNGIDVFELHIIYTFSDQIYGRYGQPTCKKCGLTH